jgi:hypothetical protein
LSALIADVQKRSWIHFFFENILVWSSECGFVGSVDSE